jgi:hypothetical protein
MSIENPISTIRKAVKELAERKASAEFLNEPEQRHYKDALTSYKMWRMMDPGSLQIGIKINALEHDYKRKMGPELFKAFDSAWIDATKNAEAELENAEMQIKETKDLTDDELTLELEKIEDRFLTKKSEEVKNDERLVNLFLENKELLNEAIDSTAGLMREYMRYNRKSLK